MSDLLANSDKYSSQNITVEGEVTKYLGEEDSWILLPYVTAHGVLLNVSETRVGKFTFADGEVEIVVSEKEGGLYLPIAVSPAGKPTLPEGRIRITGLWTKDADGNYVLYVSGTEFVPTTTP
jgi:hypothetical protein